LARSFLPSRLLAMVAALIAGAFVVTGCGTSNGVISKGPATTSGGGSGSTTGGTVVIGSADFSESEVLANMYALLAQSAGYKTQLKTVSTREIYEPALEDGQLDMVPDYEATFTEFLNHKINGPDAPAVATNNKDTTLVQLKKLAAQRGLGALEPSNAVDSDAFAVTKKFADEHNLKTLSDVAAAKLPIRLAAPAECKSRQFCGGALTQGYGINVVKYDAFEFDSVPGKKAVQDGNDDMVEVATDDGNLAPFGLVILDDDKHIQLADNLIPIVGKKFADDAKLADAINKLAPVLTSEDLGALDAQVDNDRKLPADVAKAYLTQKGLING
jgi:osmoprotectant transport system substrate-binding protein